MNYGRLSPDLVLALDLCLRKLVVVSYSYQSFLVSLGKISPLLIVLMCLHVEMPG